MSKTLKVYDNVPLPPIRRTPKGVRRKYPLDTMTVGQMVFEPGKRATRSVSAYISRISKGLPGKFTARHCWIVHNDDGEPVEVDEGVVGAVEGTGIWRIE